MDVQEIPNTKGTKVLIKKHWVPKHKTYLKKKMHEQTANRFNPMESGKPPLVFIIRPLQCLWLFMYSLCHNLFFIPTNRNYTFLLWSYMFDPFRYLIGHAHCYMVSLRVADSTKSTQRVVIYDHTAHRSLPQSLFFTSSIAKRLTSRPSSSLSSSSFFQYEDRDVSFRWRWRS